MANDIIKKIKEVIQIMDDTDVAEIEIKEGDQSVRISRQSQVAAPAAPTTVSAPAPIHAHAAAPAAPATDANGASAEDVIPSGHQVRSPMVGTMYVSPSPGAKPFVDVGQKVEVGDVLCIIEAMKMLNHIEADKAGTVQARLVDNGEPVEFDQPLFVVN